MRLSALSIGVLCLMLLQCVLVNDAAAQGKRKKGSKKNAAQSVEPESEAAPSEGEVGSEDDAQSEESAAAEENDDGKQKSINERLTEEETGGLRRSGRMEFDERLIKGQAAKSGAVYLFKRIPRHLPGLVPMRRSYRARIVEPILGAVPLKPAKYSYELSEKDLEALKAEEEKKAEAAAAEEAAAAAAAAESSSPSASQEETGTDDAPEEVPAPKKKKRK